jgi:hypothetical protein
MLLSPSEVSDERLDSGGGFVNTQRVGRHDGSCCCERARARTAADLAELAAPAFVEQCVRVTQSEEELVRSVDVDET